MSGYTIKPHQVWEDGHQFDTILERDWAGFVTHLGLRWRREPFAVREEGGPTTSRNIVSRPDFWLADISVIFECKPTEDLARGEMTKWRRAVDRTLKPIVVTTGPPRLDRVDYTSEYGSGAVNIPPSMLLVSEGGVGEAYFARCPDCAAVGIYGEIGQSQGVDERLWVSTCLHRQKWSQDSVIRAIFDRAIYRSAGVIR